MGMGNISSHLIMFIAVLSVSTLVVGVFNDQMDMTANSIVTQQNWLSQQIKTDISIEVVTFINGTENQTYIYLENTGATTLDINDVDVYIGGIRIPRNISDRTIEVLADTEVTNTGYWDPKEQVKIRVNKTLEENKTFEVIVATQYGGSDIEEFST